MRRTAASAALTTALALTLAATTPAAAQGPIPREHTAAIEATGGLYDAPQAAYVADVGARVAAAAGKAGQCRFHVINSDVVNAFTAPPGCHVYVTRGLLGLIRSEDELAAVLGHEIGHVTANHAGRRQTRSAVTGIGAAILGALTGSDAVASIAGQAAKLNVLSYSRTQEFEADALGGRTIVAGGWSPYGLADMLAALQAEDQLDDRLRGREGQPAASAWARSHPLTGERIARAAQAAQAAGPGPAGPDGRSLGPPPPKVGPYLAAIDGLLFGDDPSQGFIDGPRFVHPSLGIGFSAPAGFALTNSPQAVGIEGQGGFSGQFSAGRLARGGLEQDAYDTLRALTGNAPVQAGRANRTRINGFDAVVLPAQARASQGLVDVTVATYADGADRAYRFVTLAPAGQGARWDPLIGSLHRLDKREAAEIRPRRISVVTVKPGDTVESLAARMAYDEGRVDRFRVLNALEPGDTVRPGDRVKLVVFGRN